jgi:hypothetical protein
MTSDREHRFKIDAFTPQTLPMERLADYMVRFAKLLGEQERVHFVSVEDGSAVLVARTEPAAAPKVERRLVDLKNGCGDPAALKAQVELDDMLAEDNAVGQLLDSQGAEIIALPGRNRPKPLEYGPFREDGVLEGVVIRVGGKDDSVPIWLKDRNVIHKCSASVAVAKQLSAHYQGALVRVKGSGRWMREAGGAWRMLAFDVKDFEPLDDTPLAEIVKRLQSVEGADWGNDPPEELMRLRNGKDLN